MENQKSLDEIYTAEWFAHDFAELRPEFHFIADTLVRDFSLRPDQMVLDLGCGPGKESSLGAWARLNALARCAMKWGVWFLGGALHVARLGVHARQVALRHPGEDREEARARVTRPHAAELGIALPLLGIVRRSCAKKSES